MATQMAYALVQVTGSQDKPRNVQALQGSGVVQVEVDPSPGVFRIDFEDGLFKGAPAVLVTQAFNDFSSGGSLEPINDCTGYGGGDTIDNAVVICVERRFCRIRTGDSDGAGRYRSFSILAMGNG